MNSRQLVVFDVEEKYASQLSAYLNQKQGIPFQIRAFTSLQALMEYAKGNRIEILLISNRVMNEKIQELDIDRIILLSEGEVLQEFLKYPAIYKYQSTEVILREVMEYYAETNPNNRQIQISKKHTELIGIYSPVKRCLKTSFALTLGQLYAQSRPTLYINFEDFSGFSGLLNSDYTGDLSDLMYFYRQNQANIQFKLSAVVNSLHNLDYIPPVSFSFDLRNFEMSEWIGFMEEIMLSSNYEVIILDLSDILKDPISLLELCNTIYTPLKADAVSAAKIDEYEKYLEQTGKSSILQKTTKLVLPYHSSFGKREHYVDQLLWGELGDYTRKVMSREVTA